MREVLQIQSPELPIRAFLVTCEKKDKDSLLKTASMESMLDVCLSIHNRLINDGESVRKNIKQHSFLIKSLLGMTKNFCVNDDASIIIFKEKLASGKVVSFLFGRISYDEYLEAIASEKYNEHMTVIVVKDKESVRKNEPLNSKAFSENKGF